MIVIRLNNYRRLSAYLGKSCLAIAIVSIAWVAKMLGRRGQCLYLQSTE